MNKQFLNEEGLQSVADNVNKRLKTVETMPVNPKDKQIVLYVGETSGDFVQGHIYEYKDSLWLCYKTTPEVDPSGTHYVYLNSDKTIAANTHTGELAQSSSDFESINPIPSEFIVRDDGIYFNDGSGDILSYVRDSQNDLNESKWTDITSSGTVDQSFNPLSSNAQSGVAVNETKAVLFNKLFKADTWNNKTWQGLSSFNGGNIWTNGNNIYYSNNLDQYILNKSTSTWESKTWQGLTNFKGDNIWKDGNNIYYSNSSNQYVLNKETSTWEPKTWQGLTNFNGTYVWTDGNNIYYSDGSNHYVLDKATSTWESKTWYGLTDFYGSKYMIWKDGTNVYYSYGLSNQYVLDKATSTWESKTWYGLTDFNANNIWRDGGNIYYSRSSNHYVLNKATSTWERKTWKGLTSFYGEYIWTDGGNIYYSNTSTQYILTKSLKTYIN